ncbi:CotH kinase family protein [Planctomicrobium sp. SH527]|uniref:CotH kinase family protein n=1 Tax=Planctomicrobium sp. SH527 TaxID=3448123 RepID=UPI003F5C49D1
MFLFLVGSVTALMYVQAQDEPPQNRFRPEEGFRGQRGGPPGMMNRADRKLLDKFDQDGDGMLNSEERATAREAIKNDPSLQSRGFGPGRGGPGGGGPGRGPDGGPERGPGRQEMGPGGGPPGGFPGGPPPGGFPGGPGGGRQREPGKPGEKVDPKDVPAATGDLYDPTVFRTIFLTFESPDWEEELASFYKSDVEVPATLMVDGHVYPNVGVHFRGQSSYFTVPAGSKRSLNISVDEWNKDQRIQDYKTLNLLNSNDDPSMMHAVLYLDVARQHIAAPKANLVRLVVNGESWGVYTNVQQFDKVFAKQNFKEDTGARWKVQGSPGGRGGLEYLGPEADPYKQIYTIKSKDKAADWNALIHLCKVLNETPADQLESALEPILDVDGALWFLALENALINADGYWVRASDYTIYRDSKGKFHIIPHDTNESFQVAGGPGMGGPPGMGGRGGRGGMRGGPPGGEFGPGGGFGPGGPPGPPPGADRRDGPPQFEANPRDGGPRDGGPRGQFPGGPGGPGGMAGGRNGIELDPLVGLTDTTKPLRSKLLAVPELKERYLKYVRELAQNDLDWKKLGPKVDGYAKLLSDAVEKDTRKLSSTSAFHAAVASTSSSAGGEQGGRPQLSLKSFADQRRTFLLKATEPKMK